MMLFAVLYILSIARICHCGDDDRIVEAQPQCAVASGGSSQDGASALLSAQALDISEFDTVLYTAHYYNDTGNDVIFVVPREGVVVNKVVYGDTTIWTPRRGEEFGYAKVYTKDGEKCLLGIIKRRPKGPNCRWFENTRDGWIDCDDHVAKMKSLRVPSSRIDTFIINIEEDRDTEECRIFDTKLFGAQMRLFFANPGFLATEVRHNGVSIWKAEDEEDKICLSCNLYYENSAPSLLLVVTKVEEKEDYSYFHMQNREWKEITTPEFYVQRNKLIAQDSVVKEEEVEEPTPQRSWWSGCLGMFTSRLRAATNCMRQRENLRLKTRRRNDKYSKEETEVVEEVVGDPVASHSQGYGEDRISMDADDNDEDVDIIFDLPNDVNKMDAEDKDIGERDGDENGKSEEQTQEPEVPAGPTTDAEESKVLADAPVKKEESGKEGEYDYDYDEEELEVLVETTSDDVEKVKPTSNVVPTSEKSTETPQDASTEVVRPLSPFLTKVDTSLFDLEEAEEDVKVLKLTPKVDKVTKVKYDNRQIWSGKSRIGSDTLCSSAALYFREKPILAIIRTKSSSGKEGTVYKYYDGTKWQSCNEETHENNLEALKEDCRPIGKPEDNPPVSSAPLEQDTLNISRVDQSNLEYFEYTHDDNLIQLIAPKKGVTVAKIVRGSDTVWTPSSGEKFEYSKLYLDKDRKLVLIFVASTISSRIEYNYFAKNGTKWECARDYAEKMKSLKVVSSSKPDMSIDLAKVEDTDECRVVNVELMNIQTHFHLPKLGYPVKEVRDDEDVLWTSDGPGRCTGCAVYSKNDVRLLSLFVRDGNELHYKYFEKIDRKWNSIDNGDFNNKYNDMRSETSYSSDVASTESNEVATVKHEEQDTAVMDSSQTDADTHEDEVKPLSDAESSKEITPPSTQHVEPNEEAPTESPEDVQPEKGPEEESGDVGPSESEPSDPNVPETKVEEHKTPEDEEYNEPEADQDDSDEDEGSNCSYYSTISQDVCKE
ncbi:hypothetical protein BEWA_028660 [Theileria equi strain WA]|uniref:Signal peptide-containing protein n=1 Tax=Theileria equi strain WA TaxID=1537102 RepID=L0AYC9_THEEQ|nr:hypothetical protein BEWA_028660 [Theileria equi strain WA]AFZ80016.1 hypothetical protein BEWA_028660 [Theileria equi strain WA]|eukprot:XP_004829682.1 hypothetical protein BEWA_028660 [Theileria equi strain WA]